MSKKESIKKVELMVYVQNLKTDGKKWRKFLTRYDFVEEGKSERVTHYPQIKFKDGAFKNADVDEKTISRGIIVCDASKVSISDKWKVTKDEKTGKEVYPKCWIEDGGVLEFTAKPKEHTFHFSMPKENDDVDVEEESIDVEEVEESTPVDIE